MIITCPSCTAKFAVKAEAIGTAGRKVRCAKCKHDWFQEPLPEVLAAILAAAPTPEPEHVEPIPAGSNLPAELIAAVSPSTPLYMKAAFACFVLVFLFVVSLVDNNKLMPHFAWYYNMLGVHNDSGIALYNTSVQKEGDAKGLLVKGRIVNESKADRAIPNLRISLFDKKRKNLRVIMLDSHETVLAPGEGLDFENRIKDLPEGVDKVVMDIGNGLNLASR